MKVLVATPAGWWGFSHQYPLAMLKLADELRARGHRPTIYHYVAHYPIHVARESIAYKAVTEGYDYVVWLDSDVAPERPELLAEAVDLLLPIAVGVYVERSGEATDLAVERGGRLVALRPEDLPPNAVVRVDAAGMGCAVTAREVFERLERPWFDWTFDPTTGEGYGEDRYFFLKAKRKGIPTVALTWLRCIHSVVRDLTLG